MQKFKLSDINFHPRDANITFTEEGHKYTIKGANRNIVSTTETIGKYHEHFDADKILDKMFVTSTDGVYTGKNQLYVGKTREEIKLGWEENGKNASELGTATHQDIENFFNGDHVENPDSKEHQMFLSFWKDYLEKHPNHKEYRTEWLIYDDNPNCKSILAGSIDFTVIDENGDLHLFDWKRSKEIKKENYYTNRYEDVIHKKMYKPFNNLDDCNFNHYSLQLNFYRHVLETLYGKTIKTMRLVILHPNQENWVEHLVDRIDLSEIWHTLR
jgi:hypothetical protein